MSGGVQFLLGAGEGEMLPEVLARLAAQSAWQPFDARAVRFAACFSQRLLIDPAARPYPELMALGHWFRAAHLHQLARSHAQPEEGTLRRGRGLAFHLAPANVDSIFMYSWLLSALAGNVNIVRLSQRASAQVEIIAAVLRAVLDEHEAGASMRGRFVLLTYGHDADVTHAISQACMVRVAWGGDASVAAVRAVPLRPTAVELAFPDRFSSAALQAKAVTALEDDALARLAAAFCNDAFWFAQQACSSPRAVVWVGSPRDCATARQRFWQAVQAEVERRQPENTPAMTMARTVAAFEMAARGALQESQGFDPGSYPLRLPLRVPLTPGVRTLHCGNGLFLERDCETPAQLAAGLDDREQTLGVFGFDRESLQDFAAALPPRALDRIVPIGQALTFDPVWDGIDLFEAFSRRIRLEVRQAGPQAASGGVRPAT